MLKEVIVILFSAIFLCESQFKWQTRDAFDELKAQVDRVTPDNCNIKHVNELHLLDDGVVSHIPDIKEININPVFPNRTALLQVHNMALSRAFFYSFILQRANDSLEPGFMYYFLSSVSDIVSNPMINASAIYFAPNSSYIPSYKGFYNKTLPLFAPRAFRADDFNDPIHLQRISTLNTIEVADLGAFRPDGQSYNYTRDMYRINEWYRAWLPDTAKRQDSKATYSVQITYANNTIESFVWHGPPGADETPGPVKWTRPYFDCGRSNKWLYGATVPIVDIVPRHTGFRHVEYPTYVAASVMEIDFDRIDINQCPLGEGNPGPNKYAGTMRCKNASTECEPLHGYGFRRGGYQCRCKPGFRLPNIVRKPFLGEVLERATDYEMKRGFSCPAIGYIMFMPQKMESSDFAKSNIANMFDKTLPRNISHMERHDVERFLRYTRMAVNKDTCRDRKLFEPEDLILHGDTGYGADWQFANEARMALRLANFISSFLQLVDHNEQFAEFRLPDAPLTEDQMFGEVLSIVTGNVRIWGAGVFWEPNQFTNKTHFGPYAYKDKDNTRKYSLKDMAGLNGQDKEHLYTNKHWYKALKSRYATNTDELEEFILKIKIRANQEGVYSTRYDHYPLRFKAARLDHGKWSSPYFDCDGHNKWVMTYAAPFFGWDSLRNRLELKGVVTVTTLLINLDLDQCPDEYNVPNAFKNTNKCDKTSTQCVPILGRGFDTGGYKCECEQGYEYPFNWPITYFDGQQMEAEWEKLVYRYSNMYDILKCRISGASFLGSNIPVIFVLISFITLIGR